MVRTPVACLLGLLVATVAVAPAAAGPGDYYLTTKRAHAAIWRFDPGATIVSCRHTGRLRVRCSVQVPWPSDDGTAPRIYTYPAVVRVHRHHTQLCTPTQGSVPFC